MARAAGELLAHTLAQVAPLDAAGPAHVSFLDNRRYVSVFVASRAGACVVQPDLAAKAPAGMALLLTDEPYRAYARIAQAFYPVMPPEAGVSRAAIVHPTARLAGSCRVEPGAVIGERAEIGERTLIGATAAIGQLHHDFVPTTVAPTGHKLADLLFKVAARRLRSHVSATASFDQISDAMNSRNDSNRIVLVC